MLVKSKSLSDIDNYNSNCKYGIKNDYKSFSNFQELECRGRQHILTFGEYCRKSCTTKRNRQKVIQYFYRHLN